MVTYGEFEISLMDDGTMDTVLTVENTTTGEIREVRYDAETAAEYRDDETGDLDLAFFISEIVGPDAEMDEWGD